MWNCEWILDKLYTHNYKIHIQDLETSVFTQIVHIIWTEHVKLRMILDKSYCRKLIIRLLDSHYALEA